MKRFFVVFFLLLLLLDANAQLLKLLNKKGNFYELYELSNLNSGVFKVDLEQSLTGLSVTSNDQNIFGKIYILVGNDRFQLSENTEVESAEIPIKYFSNLISFSAPVHSFLIYSEEAFPSMQLHIYNATYTVKPTRKNSDSTIFIDCSKPSMVYPSTWRIGLDAPKAVPTYTQTEHIVIHHTAGSNTETDHLLTIRNIYLDHTLNLKWDDIGYNYLIARDGTIYSGRDGQALMADDFVKGAHFCGKNTNTMGISLMGSYSIALPTPQALLSLKKLLLWKLHKDDLNPFDTFEHPKGSIDAIPLPAVCGHRDGCATECPGLAFYMIFPSIKAEVDSLLALCQPQMIYFTENDKLQVFPNPAVDFISIEIPENNAFKACLYDLSGKLVAEKASSTSSLRLDVSSFPKGMYLLKAYTDEKLYNCTINLNRTD